MVTGPPEVGVGQSTCTSCIKGKQHREPFPKQASRRAHEPLALVHIDLCGPMQQASLGGSLYFMLIVDDFSRLTWVFFLKHKGEAFLIFKEWLLAIQKESGLMVKTVRADKGGEFTSGAMARFCANQGIKREFATQAHHRRTVLWRGRTGLWWRWRGRCWSTGVSHASCGRRQWLQQCTFSTGLLRW